MPETEENKKELIEVIRLLRVPLGLLGFPEGSLSYFQVGEQLARELGDARQLASIYSLMGSYYSHMGNHLVAIRYTEDAFEEVRNAQDIELMAPLGHSLSVSYSATGQYGKIVDKMPELIKLIEGAGRESDFFTVASNPYSFICGQCCIALSQLGRFVEGKGFLEKALRSAVKVSDPATLAMAQFSCGFLFYVEGDWNSAKEHMEECISNYEAAKWHLGVAMALCTLGHVHSYLGDPEVGRRTAEKGLQMYRESGIELFLSPFQWAMGNIQLDLGDLINAEKSMEEALKLSRKNKEKHFEGLALVGLGRVLGRKEPRELDKAEGCFIKGLKILSDQKMKPLYSQGRLFLGEFFLDRGKKEKALENLKEAEVTFQEMGMDYWLNRTKEVLGKVWT